MAASPLFKMVPIPVDTIPDLNHGRWIFQKRNDPLLQVGAANGISTIVWNHYDHGNQISPAGKLSEAANQRRQICLISGGRKA